MSSVQIVHDEEDDVEVEDVMALTGTPEDSDNEGSDESDVESASAMSDDDSEGA